MENGYSTNIDLKKKYLLPVTTQETIIANLL